MRKTMLATLCIGLCVCLCACDGDASARQDMEPTQGVDVTQPAAPTSSPESTPEAKDSYGVDEQAELNGVTVTLTQVEESTGGQFFEPEEGKVFLVCHFDISNGSEEDLAVSSIMSFEAYVDDYAASLSLSAIMASGEDQLDGSVAAGKKLAGVVGYEVDASWSELEITFKPNVWSGKDLTFTAQHS